MKGTKLLGAVLLALGILALAYGGFSYTKTTDKVNVGPIHIEVKDKENGEHPAVGGGGHRDRGRRPARAQGLAPVNRGSGGALDRALARGRCEWA